MKLLTCVILFQSILFLIVGFYVTKDTTSPSALLDDKIIIETKRHKRYHKKIEKKENNRFDRKTIRRWGCSRNETPFIFVHVGKAGGGSVRRMIAAAALNYTKPNSKRVRQDTAFYPIHLNNSFTIAKARYASSKHRNYRPIAAHHIMRSTERNVPCDAETPIGQATACPPTRSMCPKDDGPTSSSCHLVYMGHNFLGNEMHWLSNGYLERWWESIVGSQTNNAIPSWYDIPKCRFPECNPKREGKNLTKIGHEVDYLATQAVSSAYWKNVTDDNGRKINPSWAPIYASLPLLRVTMTREPFSWLASKFSWHQIGAEGHPWKKLSYDNIEEMTRRSADGFTKMMCRENGFGPGWANHFALLQIMASCGEDCLVRYIHGSATLKDVEQQAEENLRNSYAVVGLLAEHQSFYNMISARVAYMANLTQNAHLIARGGKHKAGGLEVKKKYANLSFQKQLINASPEIAALERLYKVSVEVNQFQLKELQTCPSWNSNEE